ncbi:MAG TPA: L-seryl-tRNA(Sec) selenium transferase [Verrucomicrobiae bacterium]|nr:L-seryl-tRNA(Sec) selenium transferase [Verrucomicrobiae bacterium]
MSDNAKLRAIPAIEKLLQSLGQIDMPRPALVAVVRREVAALRKEPAIPSYDEVLARVRKSVDQLRAQRIQPVLNGTGIIIHTNLGRSPLSSAVLETLQSIGGDYNNLEYDLVAGERGGRAGYLEHNLAILCGAEAATVTNNCAAALVLALRHFTSGERKEVIISRGELVQIGGGFRIPEVLEASGCTLREIGATNKTSLADYRRAISKNTAIILKVHRSNFFMCGFIESPSTEELSELARSKRLPFIEDLGSGAIVETADIPGAEHEPTPAEVLKRGVDLVTFSGDKLFGGPQAGIIVGKAKMVAALKREPFFRALRCDKLILSALQTAVDCYLHGAPTMANVIDLMLRASKEELETRAKSIITNLGGVPAKITIGLGKAQVGGGTLPKAVIESVTIDVIPKNISLADFAARLRSGPMPLIGYVSANRFKIDLRTILKSRDVDVIRALQQALVK